MGKQASKNPIKQKREKKRLAKLEKEGRLVAGLEIPKGHLAAEPEKQNHTSLYSIKLSYKDIEYTCRGCGKEEVWTAEQQKKYFEARKGNIHNEPTWCHDYYLKRVKEKYGEK